MGLIFLVWRLCYHIFSEQKYSHDNLISATKNDFVKLCDYARQIIFSNPTKFKIIIVIIACFIISTMMPLEPYVLEILETALFAIIFFLMVIVFAPQKDPTQKKFPVEIFGFIYSIVMMYCCAGEFVVDFFSENNFQNMWIYGYIVILISYFICMATVSRFMERDLSRIEIIFVGMIMMTILEFLTYYGVGFFYGIKFFTPEKLWNIFESSNFLKWISIIINQGIYIASQSQILERDTSEILGYIILNGTDVLTVTAVLGYVLQKFMGIEQNSK